MCPSQLKIIKSLAISTALLCSFESSALEFLPGVGVGLEYTDNATLSADNPVDDLIAVGYVGAKLEETTGPVRADITASLNHHRYTKDTFDDKRYFNLGATAGWEMIQDRFDWFLTNIYRQRPINTTDPNTPDNIQDSNIFTFGANMRYPISARQTFTLRPEYRNFYYEVQRTDNQQYSLVASWDYLLSPITTVGVNGSVRAVDYTEPAIDDVIFSSVFFAVTSQRARSSFNTNLGATGVERDNGQSTEEFAGNLNWLLNLTDRSRFRTFMSTDLTDSSAGALNATVDPGTGDPNDIQISTDVIRSQVISLGYSREDGTLKSNLTGMLRQLNYSESPNDRRIRSLKAALNYPVTALLSSGFYARYSHTEYIDTLRTDNNYTIGGGVRYQLSRKLNSSFDLKYRNRDSTLETRSYDEWSAYVSLVYGFGQPMRPTRSGGF
jgi:hypothetical protein